MNDHPSNTQHSLTLSLRKAEETPKNEGPRCFAYHFEDCELSVDDQQGVYVLCRGGKDLKLEPKVLKTLVVLVREAGKPVKKEAIIKEVWEDVTVSEDSLTRNISELRKKLNLEKKGRRSIESIPKVGYRLNVDVSKTLEQAIDEPAEPSNVVRKLKQPQRFWLDAYSIRPWLAIATLAGCLAALGIWAGKTAAFSQASPRVVRIHQLTHDGFEKDGRLCTDGQYVYFSEFQSGQYKIAGASVHGGETLYVPTSAGDLRLVDMAHDGSGFLVTNSRGTNPELMAMSRLGGSPSTIHLNSQDASWSWDRRRIAYVTNDRHALIVAGADGSQAREILRFSTNELPRKTIYYPRWAPDGSKLRFTVSEASYSEGSGSLWEITPDGSEFHPLFASSNRPIEQRLGAEYEGNGSWTSNGKYFVFDGVRDGREGIWALPEHVPSFFGRNNHPVRLTDGPMDLAGPVPSHDGRRLFVWGKQRHTELVRYVAKSKLFLPYVQGVSGIQPDVSPDGEWITYVAVPEGTLWRSRLDGSEKLQLTFPPLSVDSPHWSPDGLRIAFRASLSAHAKKVFVVSRNGGTPEKLNVLSQEVEEGVPTWSSDGNSLVLGELHWHPDQIAIHIVDLKTRKAQIVAGSRGLWTPRWSPRGRFLLALKANPESSTSQQIHVFDFYTKRWRLVLRHAVDEPAWSHDERFIYFYLGSPKQRAVFRVRVSDGQLEQVIKLDDFRDLWATAFSLAADDSPLLTRDARNTEIYALEIEWP
jgi:Tol biopolymer transport system component/DNA-binding winged helix-turn-helix (wHTH) protein